MKGRNFMYRKNRRIIAIVIIVVLILNVLLIPTNASILNAVTPKASILYEDESKRDLFEKHFVCSDGSYIAVSYPEQVCYRDKDNEWKLINNTFSVKNERYIAVSADYSISFPFEYQNSQNVDFKQNNNLLSWCVSLIDKDNKKTAATVVEEKRNKDILSANDIESHINYYGISNGIDLCYTVLPNRVKENIILNERTDFSGYKMYFKKNGLTPTIKADNSIEFVDTNHRTVFEIQTPYMFDQNYKISYDIKIMVEEDVNYYVISIIPSTEWLNSPSVSYPVTIDPTVRTSTSKINFSDTYIYENSTASESRALEERLRIGIYNNTIYRVLWKTSVLPSIPSPYTITSASFILKFPDATTTSRTFSLYKLNSAWNSYTITWNAANALSKTSLATGVARNATANTLTFGVTNTVKSWYSGTTNNGFLIKYTSESLTNPDYNLFYSSDNTTSTSYMPYITITYTISTTNGLPLDSYPVGSYFTDNKEPCSHSDGDYSACSYTNESACNCKIYDASIQCMAFAKFVYANYANMTESNFHTVYNNGTEKKNFNRSFSGSSSTAKNILQSLTPGSYVRFTRSSGYGHSVVIISTDTNGITVYECNNNRICDVGTRTIPYSTVANSFSGVEFTMSHNFTNYSTYNSVYHKRLCSYSGCNGYILEKHSTSGTCPCGYSS